MRRALGELNTLLDRLEFDPAQLPSSRCVVQRLEETLPDDRVVISDAGQFMRWVVQGLTVRDPLDFSWTADFASIGQGLAVAAGRPPPERPALHSADERAAFIQVPSPVQLTPARVTAHDDFHLVQRLVWHYLTPNPMMLTGCRIGSTVGCWCQVGCSERAP